MEIGRRPLILVFKSSHRLRAVSLIELLIVFFIFSIVVLLVSDMSRLAIHSQASTTDKVEARRLASIVLTKMRFEFCTCRSLASPDPNVGTDGWWSPSLAEPLSLHVNGNGGTKLVTYWHDPSKGVLWKRAQGEERPILREVETFEFQQAPGPGAHLMKAQVKMKKLQQPVTVWGRAIRV